jgi:hypothetical protein
MLLRQADKKWASQNHFAVRPFASVYTFRAIFTLEMNLRVFFGATDALHSQRRRVSTAKRQTRREAGTQSYGPLLIRGGRAAEQ